MSSLHEAIENQNETNFKSIISTGADINAYDSYKLTPLHYGK